MNSENTFLRIYNDFTSNILSNYSNGKNNLVLSPFSILVLLCMAADSTDSETKEEIIRIISKDQPYDDIKKTMIELSDKLSEDNTLSIANALCVNETIKNSIKDGFKEQLNKNYNSKLFASKNIVDDVNKWVNEKTKGMINKLADKTMENMLACLMNAICFEAEWDEQYEEDDIYEDDFHNADGTIGEVEMLGSDEYEYINNDRYEGFVKPYKDNKYSYMALLPKDESADSLSHLFSSLDLSRIFKERIDRKVRVEMPEFRYDFSEDLTTYLESLGMTRVFTPGADFSPMTDEWIQASGIIHKAHIEVDRKGTKAAAASAMFMVGSAPDFDKPFICLNRPFIYAIIHNETGLPLFAGIASKL